MNFPLPTTAAQCLLAWFLLFSLQFLGVVLVLFFRPSESGASLFSLPLRALKAIDLFSLSHDVSDQSSPVKQCTPLGGLFSLMALTTLITYAAYMTASWAQDNTLVQKSLAILGPSAWSELAGLPWVAVPLGSALGPLALRVTIDGNPGACAKPSMSFTGLEGGGKFQLESTVDCGGSGVAQHTLTCPSCRFTSDTSVTLVFDYSCQSMLLEAQSASPSHPSPLSLASLAAPTSLTVAPKPGSLLTSVAWQLTPVLSVLWDNSTLRSSGMGWSFGGSKVTWSRPPSTPPVNPDGIPSLTPLASSVSVTFSLPLSSPYSVTLLTQRVPITQLLANIVGLSGVLAFFGLTFGFFESWTLKRRPLAPGLVREGGKSQGSGVARTRNVGWGGWSGFSRKRGVISSTASEVSGGGGGVRLSNFDDALHTQNPLHLTQRPTPPPREDSCMPSEGDTLNAVFEGGLPARFSGEEPKPSFDDAQEPHKGATWTRIRDEQDEWFVCEATGETSWSAPEGSVIKDGV